VPVALMQPDQGAMGQHAYMLVNRDDLYGQQHMMGMHASPGHHKHPDEDGLLDVLVGAADQVEAAPERDEDVNEEDDDEPKEPKVLTTRSGRKRNPTRTY
jgi:hypothetical protein